MRHLAWEQSLEAAGSHDQVILSAPRGAEAVHPGGAEGSKGVSPAAATEDSPSEGCFALSAHKNHSAQPSTCTR